MWRARVTWRHPEWWILALSAGAWGYMLAGDIAWSVRRIHDAPGAHVPALSAQAVLADLRTWVVMTVAMMVPLVSGPLRAVALRSLWCRRHRAMALFLIGYVAVWLIAGVAAVLATRTSGVFPNSAPLTAAVGFLLAAAWHDLPLRRRALTSCHFTMPIAPSGWKADADCLRYGCGIGRRCVVSCWALMLACALARHSPVAMLCTAALMLTERFAFRPRPHLAIATLALLALVSVAAAVP